MVDIKTRKKIASNEEIRSWLMANEPEKYRAWQNSKSPWLADWLLFNYPDILERYYRDRIRILVNVTST